VGVALVVGNTICYLVFRNFEVKYRAVSTSPKAECPSGRKQEHSYCLDMLLVLGGVLQLAFAMAYPNIRRQLVPGSLFLFAGSTLLIGAWYIVRAVRRRE
jgi:hypothetical protein